MPFSYVVHRELRLVVSTGSGRLSWNEIKRCQDLSKSDVDFNPEFDQIVDLRSVTMFDMRAEHLRVLARSSIFPFASKRAFVASNSIALGIARMWEAYTELSDNPSRVQVFYDLTSALKWLRSPQ